MTLEATDQRAEAHRKGFRITLDDIKGRVESVEFIERGVLNVAIVQLNNGYWLVGRSAPVDVTNYNSQYGRDLAYEDALRQAWPLLAFAHLEESTV